MHGFFVQKVLVLCKIVQPYFLVLQVVTSVEKPVARMHDFFLDF